MKQTVLITAIGGDIAQGVAAILKEVRPDYRLIGADIQDSHAGGYYVESLFKLPRADDPRYQESLYRLAEKEKADFVIPMAEPELRALAPHLDTPAPWTWITAGRTVVTTGLDKWETNRRLSQLGIPVPWTVLASEQPPLNYPCIFKLRHSWGSRHLAVIKSKAEADYMSSSFSDGIFQEFLEPEEKEVTCGVYRTRQGKTAVIPFLRRLSCGTTTWARVIADPETTAMCELAARGLELQGSMNVQLRITQKGPRIFEINPRFSSTALMRHRLGFSDVLWSLDESENKAIQFPDLKAGQTVIRVYDAAVL